MYPVLFGALALQIATRASMVHPWDLWVAWLLPVPAVLDWARGRFRPESGTNFIRFLTGVLLGVALGRTIYLHLREPLHPLAMKQLFAILGVAAAVELLARSRRIERAEDPFSVSFVEGGQGTGEGTETLEAHDQDQDRDGPASH